MRAAQQCTRAFLHEILAPRFDPHLNCECKTAGNIEHGAVSIEQAAQSTEHRAQSRRHAPSLPGAVRGLPRTLIRSSFTDLNRREDMAADLEENCMVFCRCALRSCQSKPTKPKHKPVRGSAREGKGQRHNSALPACLQGLPAPTTRSHTDLAVTNSAHYGTRPKCGDHLTSTMITMPVTHTPWPQ